MPYSDNSDLRNWRLAGGDANPFQDCMLTNPYLNFLYLYLTQNLSDGRFSQDSILNFLLWYATEGRVKFPEVAYFSPIYVDLLNLRVGSENNALLVDQIDAGREPFVHAGLLLRDTAISGGSLAGVSIIGFHKYAMGLGEDARRLFEVLRLLGRPVDLVDIGNEGLEQIMEGESYRAYESTRPIFPILIFCAPLFELGRVIAEWGRGAFLNRYVIAAAPWELSEFPRCWAPVFDVVDEVWAASQFLKSTYCSATTKPIIHMPLHVIAAPPDKTVTEVLSLEDETFCFLSLVDFNSTLDRKNSVGSVLAFKSAFRQGQKDVALIIKTLNADASGAEWKSLIDHIGHDDRVVILDGVLSKEQISGLIARAEVFVSLHRSEGFGRVIAEAMLLGTLVIATNWSGSQDIIDAETGMLVDFRLVDVSCRDYPEAVGVWAEPDLFHAATCMRQAYDRYEDFDTMRCRAAESIRNKFSLEAIAPLVRVRLAEVDAKLEATSSRG